MTDYKELLMAFDNDGLLLDLHLSNIKVEGNLYEEYIGILIESTIATQNIRSNWKPHDQDAFDIKVIKSIKYEQLPPLLKSRRLAYKANEPDKINRYKELTQQ